MQEFLNTAQLFAMTPWKQKDINVFLLLDSADAEGLVTKAVSKWPQRKVVQLYQRTKEEEDAAIGPHLVKVTRDSQLMQWFLKEGAEYGIILFSKVSAEMLGEHLRPFLECILPGERKRMFRFYDPMTFYYFLPSLTAEEIVLFMGPACGAACTRPVCATDGDSLFVEHSVGLEWDAPPKSKIPWFISDQTYREFNTPAQYALARMLADDYEEMFPRLAKILKRDRVVAFTAKVVARNEELGWPTREYLGYLMLYTSYLGIDFEQDPQYERIAKCLRTEERPKQQLMDISNAILEYNAAVWDKFGKPYFMAFKRYLAMSYADLYTINSIQEVVTHMKQLYPEKAQYVGDEALRAIGKRAVEKAKEWGLTPRPGNALCAGILFLIGHGCDHDPIRPWIGDYIKREMSPTEKTRKVFDASRRIVRLNFKMRKLNSEQEEVLNAYPIVLPLENLSLPIWSQYPLNLSLNDALCILHPRLKEGEEMDWAMHLQQTIPDTTLSKLPTPIQALLALGYTINELTPKEISFTQFAPDINAIQAQCSNGLWEQAAHVLTGQIRHAASQAAGNMYKEYGGDII